MEGDDQGHSVRIGPVDTSLATFGKRFGYMEQACHFNNTIYIAVQVSDYVAMVGQMPFLDFLLDKNVVKCIGLPNLSNVTRISDRQND